MENTRNRDADGREILDHLVIDAVGAFVPQGRTDKKDVIDGPANGAGRLIARDELGTVVKPDLQEHDNAVRAVYKAEPAHRRGEVGGDHDMESTLRVPQVIQQRKSRE